ncbi:MAG: glycosyltransferase, partial [Candidatus Brocadiae bacterium]|nr:glycosyltransferase [Candidatus Brocadiia bacterium]
QEGKLFQSLGGQGKIVAIPNGVDIDYFKRQDESIPMENAFIFTGVMNYFPNVDTILCFYHEVYPLIKNIMPEIRFYIVGSRPAPEIVAIGQQDPSCIVTGYVPDVRPYMCKAKLFVAPMKVAQGMQNKILEAMSMSVPVITYSQIAQPLGLDENDGVVKVNDPLEMSRAIERLMHNEEERARLARSARKSVVEKYHWKPQLQKLTNLVEEITAAKPV